jgi:PAS domain S-box-containing protein
VPEGLAGKGLAQVSGAVPVAPVAALPRESAPEAEEQKPVLKAVGGPVRLAVRPAGEPGAVVAAAPAGPTPVRPSFGLRPKADAPKAETAAAALATAAGTGVVERDSEATVMVRPKVDQRALYYQLMNGLYDAVLVLDDQGHIVDCNNRVAEMLGYSREEAWDMPIGKVITGMVSQMFEHLKRNLAENHHVLIDARCYRKDGTSFAGEVGVSLISLTRGSNMVFAIRSVERRKNAMDDLRKSQAALEIAFAPAFVCDTDGFFVVANQALLDLFGIPDAEQAKGARFMDLLPDAARLFLRASCGEKIRETLNVPTPDGLQVKLQLALMPLQSGQNVTGVAGSIQQM